MPLPTGFVEQFEAATAAGLTLIHGKAPHHPRDRPRGCDHCFRRPCGVHRDRDRAIILRRTRHRGSGSRSSDAPLPRGREYDHWSLTRVTLVLEADDLPAVVPEIPPSGLTREGFPGPVWVVMLSADLQCDSLHERTTVQYIFEASSGAPLIQGGGRCPPYGKTPRRG
jgi:hypothetical protein